MNTRVIEEIAELIGFRGAYELSLQRAGTSFYVPVDPAPQHWLNDILTPDEIQALAARFGGETITLPPLRDNTRHRIEVALKNKLEVRMVAMLANRSERYVARVKEELAQAGRLPSDAA
ncbi:hypothetical protein [Thioalkalivibrio sp. ALJ16]|uniref:hypothetical protein n=1 Tax=Thioalkalivibrio sp. ALJ16 TaxID=1158762 RepID=UPI00037D09B7|nr:hypothetical protein [Thioalkalivibrio sp. ALJ16]